MVQPIPQQSWVIDGTMIVEEYLARKVSEGTTPPMGTDTQEEENYPISISRQAGAKGESCAPIRSFVRHRCFQESNPIEARP